MPVYILSVSKRQQLIWTLYVIVFKRVICWLRHITEQYFVLCLCHTWFFLKAHLTKTIFIRVYRVGGLLMSCFASRIIVWTSAWYVRDLSKKFKKNYSLAGEFKPDTLNCYWLMIVINGWTLRSYVSHMTKIKLLNSFESQIIRIVNIYWLLLGFQPDTKYFTYVI